MYFFDTLLLLKYYNYQRFINDFIGFLHWHETCIYYGRGNKTMFSKIIELSIIFWGGLLFSIFIEYAVRYSINKVRRNKKRVV